MTFRSNWCGQKAVFKFTEVTIEFGRTESDVLGDRNKRQNEVNQLKKAEGEGVLPILGHYRYFVRV